MDGWMDGWMGGQTDERINRLICNDASLNFYSKETVKIEKNTI